MLNLGFWLRHPLLILPRLRYRNWERKNPDKPWLTPAAVDFLDRKLTPLMTGFEFGSGRSTAWYGGKLAHLTSVEHNADWFARVAAELSKAHVANVKYEFLPLDHPYEACEQEQYEPLPAYVARIKSVGRETLDLVVVDGHYRTACIAASLDALRRGGWLVVDDAQRWPNRRPLPIPADWPLAHASTNGVKWTCIFQRPHTNGNP